jgi:hypothetical protein
MKVLIEEEKSIGSYIDQNSITRDIIKKKKMI